MDKHIKYRMIIMDNYQEPSCFLASEKISDNFQKVETLPKKNCADKFNIYLYIEGDKIADAKFNGNGCAISTASTNILLSSLISLTKDEALALISKYKELVLTGKGDEKEMNDLIVFETVHKLDNRKSCALMSAEAVEQYIKGDTND